MLSPVHYTIPALLYTLLTETSTRVSRNCLLTTINGKNGLIYSRGRFHQTLSTDLAIWQSGICSSDLILFFCRAVRFVLEYSCQLFHSCLLCYLSDLSDKIERIQRRAMRIIFPDLKYSSALREAGIPILYDRKEKLSCH